MAFLLEPLPYPADALEPHFDAGTMIVHHDKHHAAYIAKLNAALEKAPEWQGKPVEELLSSLDAVPESIRSAVRNHGGGHFNHSLFWPTLSPDGGGSPSGSLAKALERDFGSVDSFKDQFSAAALGLFGSGWEWLCVGPGSRLSLMALPNQDSPLSKGLVPILGLDVWEHAYYLKYQNRRADYISAFWNLVNWKRISENLDKA